MSVQLTVTAALAGLETIGSTESPSSSSGGNQRQYNAYNESGVQLDASSTPSVDVTPVDLSFTLTAATKTFDLTAVPQAKDIDVNIDLTGYKLIGLLVRTNTANDTGGFTLKGNGANAYNLFGTSGVLTFWPGEVGLKSFLDAAAQTPAVAAGAKDLIVTGTAGDKADVIAYFGS